MIEHNFVFRLDDRGHLFRSLLDVLSPSVCGILRSGPSSTLQHCGREEGSWTLTSLNSSSWKSIFSNISNSSSPTVKRKKMGFKDNDISEVGDQFPSPTTVLKSAERTTPEAAAYIQWQKMSKVFNIRPY